MASNEDFSIIIWHCQNGHHVTGELTIAFSENLGELGFPTGEDAHYCMVCLYISMVRAFSLTPMTPERKQLELSDSMFDDIGSTMTEEDDHEETW